MQSLYAKLTEIETRGEAAALCIVTETRGSTPLKAGAKMIVWDDGRIFGTIGGGNLEFSVIEEAKTVIKSNLPQTAEHHLVQDHEMCCGGTVIIYIEPVMVPRKLYIFGAGHIGRQLAEFAGALPFRITLIDERAEMLTAFSGKDVELYAETHEKVLPLLAFDSNTFIVICTHQHAYDRAILAYCLRRPFAYLGMIGSKRKVAVTRRAFTLNGDFTEEELDRVDMPMGLDIGGQSAAEIAISILAKLIAVKNQKTELNPQSQIHATTNSSG